jgi:hypothetical protein
MTNTNRRSLVGRCDLHFHSMLSRRLPFDQDHFLSLLRAARERRVDSIVLTDHIDSRDFVVVRRYLSERHLPEGDFYRVEGIRLFPGTEVETVDGAHVLIVGAYPELEALHERLEPIHVGGSFASVSTLLATVADLNVLTIWAHPFRFVGITDMSEPNSGPLSDEIARSFDAIDLNAKDIYLYGREMINHVYRAAERWELPCSPPAELSVS